MFERICADHAPKLLSERHRHRIHQNGCAGSSDFFSFRARIGVSSNRVARAEFSLAITRR